MEVYYEQLLKLMNSLQTQTIDSFLNIMCRSRLQPYLRVATTRMKWETLQHHKKETFINGKGISKVETNNLLHTSNYKVCNSTNFLNRNR
jgi:hypothetical protein